MKKRAAGKPRILTPPILLYGSTSDCPDMQYRTGFRAHDPVVALSDGRHATLVVPDMELGRAQAEAAPGVEVVTPRQIGLVSRRSRGPAAWALRLVRRAGLRRVLVSGAFPTVIAERLRKAGLRLLLAQGDLFPARARKTTAELRRIAEAQQAAVIAMRAAVRMISESSAGRDGALSYRGEPLTSERVRRRIASVLLDLDCFCRDTIVAGGRHTVDPHDAGTGPLRAGEPIVLDTFPQHLRHGYFGDLTRTVVKGPCRPELQRMYRAVRAAQNAALSHLRAGASCAAVHAAAAAEFRRRGYANGERDGRPEGFIHGTGHGVGLAVHESPRLGAGDGRLRAGNVVTVEPGLYYADRGGIRIEDTVVVTAAGWRCLAPCEKRFEV